MNNISVPSRFACLKIEDDDVNRSSSNNKSGANRKPDKTQSQKRSAAAGGKTSNSNKNKASSNDKRAQHQSKTSKSTARNNNIQWEDWKRKDSEMVDENFQQDLQCALLQSKMEFDKRRKVLNISKGAADVKKNKKGRTTMGLSEFLEKPDLQKEEGQLGVKEEEEESQLEQMLQVAKNQASNFKLQEEVKEREKNIDQVISIAHLQDKLSLERKKNQLLEKQLEEARSEVANVKARNKTLCSMLGQGEMRDKADILLELERLNQVKDELTEEVARLHKSLEQERSNSSNSKHAKDKKRK